MNTKLIFKWIAGILLLLSGLGALRHGIFIATFAYIMGGLICLPPTLKIIADKTNFTFQSWHKYTIIIISFVVGGMVMSKKDKFTPLNNSSSKTNISTSDISETDNYNKKGQKKIENKLFDEPQKICNLLSDVGIGELQEWTKPLDMEWGSLTHYYPFGPQKNGIGMQNNLSYYLEGTENSVGKILINLNINNPSDKKNALKYFNEVTVKTFKSINLELPDNLSKAILNSKPYRQDLNGFIISNKLEESKIESWNVEIIRNI